MLAEPGVSYVDQVRFEVDEAPEAGITSLCADGFQARTFFAAAGDALYRTANDGDGWELLARFPGESAEQVRAHPHVPGHVVLVTRVAGANGGCRDGYKCLHAKGVEGTDAQDVCVPAAGQ